MSSPTSVTYIDVKMITIRTRGRETRTMTVGGPINFRPKLTKADQIRPASPDSHYSKWPFDYLSV